MYAAVHSYSCICLLRGVACSLGVIAYILLYMRSLPSSSTVMYLVRLSYECHAEVNFDTSLSLRMLLFHSVYSVREYSCFTCRHFVLWLVSLY